MSDGSDGIAVGTGEAWCVLCDVDGLSSVPLAVGESDKGAWAAFEAARLHEAKRRGEVVFPADEAWFLKSLRESEELSTIRCAVRFACFTDGRSGDDAPLSVHLNDQAAIDKAAAQAVAAEREALRAEIVSRASFEYSDGDIEAYAALRNMLPWLDARSKGGAK